MSDPVTLIDSSLLDGLRRGSEAAYERLVRELGPRLLGTARRFLRSEADAQDAVQEAFLAAFRALPAFHGESSLSTWLHRIAINTCLMRLRSRRRRPERPIDEMLPGFLEDGHHAGPVDEWAPEDELLRGETQGLVRAAIDRLPESYRAVLLLRDVEELSTAEAARALGTSEGAVKLRLHRARQALRELLAPAFGSSREARGSSLDPRRSSPGPARRVGRRNLAPPQDPPVARGSAPVEASPAP